MSSFRDEIFPMMLWFHDLIFFSLTINLEKRNNKEKRKNDNN